MAQFTKYSSTDASAPSLTGTVGSLITVLDAVLINGYGSKAAAGWSKPVATVGNISTYKQGAASKAGCTLLINDNGPTAHGAKEASACGWRTCTSVAATMGAGNGQFPIPTQSLTTGRLVINKSGLLDSTARPWTIFADDKTFWLFIRSSSNLAGYLGQAYAMPFGFGEFYSYWGTSDAANCMIHGFSADSLTTPGATSGGVDVCCPPGSALLPGLFLADSPSGAQGSQKSFPMGDANRMALLSGSSMNSLVGLGPCPNPSDGAIFIVPILILDGQTATRGRHRGLYAWMHPLGATSDGAVYVGANDLAGKTLVSVAPTFANTALIVETSNTLDTN